MHERRTPPLLVTPDAVGVDLDVATVGSRAVAFLLDLLILAAGLLVMSLAGSLFAAQGLTSVVGPGSWLGAALVLLLLFALFFGYPIAFETLRRGRTPGKAALGLRVVTVEGAPVALRHSAIRALLAVIELYGLLGAPAMISSLVSSRAQRLGDLTAGTMVVRERRAARTPVAERFVAPGGLEGYTAQLDVSGLGSADYVTVRDTLRRSTDLPEPARSDVVVGLARTLLDRVRPAPPEGVDARTFLRCVAAAIQLRSEAQQPRWSPPTGQHTGASTPPEPRRAAGPGGVRDEGPNPPSSTASGGFAPPS
jgi:uncharacterized RDD family membrane protein YckC